MSLIESVFGKSLTDKIFNFAWVCGLEIHVSNQETRTRIVLLLPNGCTYSNGSRANMEVAEAEGKDQTECTLNLYEQLKKRDSEIAEILGKRRRNEDIKDSKAC